MLKDRFGRDITYIRFSVTERCNFRCLYCSSYKETLQDEEPTLDEIEFIFRVLSSVGFSKVRITGGEPLVRNDIVDIVRLANVSGFKEIVLTTNGYRLKDIVRDLKDAGLNRLNISLDSLRRDVFHFITSVDKFEDVVEGINASISLGFSPIKINTVLLKGINESDILPIARLTENPNVIVRFIELMPVKGNNFFDKHFLSYKEALSIIEKEYPVEPLDNPLYEVARYFAIGDFKGKIGFITSVSQHFCNTCNRLRLTSTYKIFPCLFSTSFVSIKEAVKSRDENKLKELLYEAVYIKPRAHGEIRIGSKEFIENMRELGG